MKNKLLTLTTLTLLATLGPPIGTPLAWAATRTVTAANDSGAGSLRQAILDASSGDTIDFSVTGAITLTSGELLLCKNLTILGPGATNLTLSGNNASRVLTVCTNTTVAMKALTIANGSSTNGGGIYNNGGTVSLTNCVVSLNTAPYFNGDLSGAAIYNNGGSLVLAGCAVSDNSIPPHAGGWSVPFSCRGGAIYNAGTLLASTCLFSNNVIWGGDSMNNGDSASGGALYNAAGSSAEIMSSTFVNNTANGGTDGGGSGYGGAADGAAISSSGGLVLRNVTFTTNRAGGGSSYSYMGNPSAGHGGSGHGGAIASTGVTTLTNCTLSADGARGGFGGVYGVGGSGYGGELYCGAGTITLKNTLFAYSLYCTNVWGTFTDAGHNLCSDDSSGFTAGTSRTNLDPLLGTLGYYGGATPTIPLLAGSPAIDTGENAAAPATDQRGYPRPYGTAADIGAYEWSQPATRTVTTTNDNGTGSLRQTIADATQGDTINFAVTGTIVLTNGAMSLCKSLTIAGPGTTNLTLSGNNASRVLYVCTNTTLTLSNLTIANGYSTNGGGIYNDGGTLALTGCTLRSNRAAVVILAPGQPPPAPKGGAIYNLGSITATNCLFLTNSASEDGSVWIDWGPGDTTRGGAVCNFGAMQESGCLFQGNWVVGIPAANIKGGDAAGGAVFNSTTATHSALNSTYAGNSAQGGWAGQAPGGDGLGGAIYGGSQVLLSNVAFVANVAFGGSGGPFNAALWSGGNAMGGAVNCPAGLWNVTFATNQAIGGPGGSSMMGGNGKGGNAMGGAAYGATGLTNCSLAANGAFGGPGGQGYGYPDGPNGTGQGGGIYSGGTLKNTLVAYSPSGSNFWGTITDAGNNLSSDSTGGFTAGSSHVNTDPVLGPLGYYGGPTRTLPLLSGSPAIDAADTAAAPSADQRGYPRPYGAAADIGAYEWAPAPVRPQFVSLQPPGPGGMTLTLSGDTGRVLEIHASSNLTQWSWLVTLTNTTGQVAYTDAGATNQPRRFYKAIQVP